MRSTDPGFAALVAFSLLVHFGWIVVMFSDLSDPLLEPELRFQKVVAKVSRVPVSPEQMQPIVMNKNKRRDWFHPIDHTDANFCRQRCMMSPHGAVALRAIEKCNAIEKLVHGSSDYRPVTFE